MRMLSVDHDGEAVEGGASPVAGEMVEDEGRGGENGKDPTQDDLPCHRRRLRVDGIIWLHSLRYVLPDAGLDVLAPLPQWACSAAAELAHHLEQSAMK